MPTVDIENGKRIDMLLEADSISDNSYILISEKSLTRKLSLLRLRKTLCADKIDDGKDSLYYSASFMDTKISSIYNTISKAQLSIDNINNRLNTVFQDFGGSVDELKNTLDQNYKNLLDEDQKLKQYLIEADKDLKDYLLAEDDKLKQYLSQQDENLKQYLLEADNTLKQYLLEQDEIIKDDVKNKYDALLETINTIQLTHTNDISDISSRLNTLQNTVTNLTNTLNNFMDRFTISNNIPPDNLENGKIYLQYFD